VIEPDGDVDEGLEQRSILPACLRPRFLQNVVALEVELPVEESGGAMENVAIDHSGMVSRPASHRN
jgi:hypothetical protein